MGKMVFYVDVLGTWIPQFLHCFVDLFIVHRSAETVGLMCILQLEYHIAHMAVNSLKVLTLLS